MGKVDGPRPGGGGVILFSSFSTKTERPSPLAKCAKNGEGGYQIGGLDGWKFKLWTQFKASVFGLG